MKTHVRQMFVVAGMQLRRIVLDRGTALWLLALPIVLIGLLGLSLQGLMSANFALAKPFVVALAFTGSPADAAVLQALESQPQFFTVISVDSADEARRLVLRREAEAAVLVSASFPAEPLRIVGEPNAIVVEVLEEVLRRASLFPRDNSGSKVRTERSEIRVTENGAGNTAPPWLKADAYGYYAVAITAMFAMFAAHTAMVNSARDRASDVYARVRTYGVTPAGYMLAGSVVSVIAAVLFITVLSAATRLLFGVHWGEPRAWLLLTLFGGAAAAGLSFVIMAIVPDSEHIDGAASAIFNVLAFLGGSMAPLVVLPEWFRRSFTWLPNRAMLEGYLKVSQGADVAAVSAELLTMVAAASVLFVFGWMIWTWRARREAQ